VEGGLNASLYKEELSVGCMRGYIKSEAAVKQATHHIKHTPSPHRTASRVRVEVIHKKDT
jgi:hypothetical protein